MIRGERAKIKVVELADVTAEMLNKYLQDLLGDPDKTGKADNVGATKPGR